MRKHSHALKDILNPTPEVCMEAVKQKGNAIMYVEHQTPEICKEAIKWDANAIGFIKEQTPELCMDAVKKDWTLIRHVKKPTQELCNEVLRQNKDGLENTYEFLHMHSQYFPYEIIQYFSPENVAKIKKNYEVSQFVSSITLDYIPKIDMTDEKKDENVHYMGGIGIVKKH